MNWMNDLFYAQVLTSITGTIAYLAWQLVKVWMEKHKKLRFVYPILTGVLPFFLLPIVYMHLRMKSTYGNPENTYKGMLFVGTPMINKVLFIASLVWMTGMVIHLADSFVNIWKLHVQLGKSFIAPEVYIGVKAERIRRELGIGKNVRIYQSYGIRSPLVTGFFVKNVVLPVQNYEENELEAVLYHEMVHIRQNIVDLKNIGRIIKIFHWINPCVYLLIKDLEEWGETACDLEVHYNTECSLTFQEYFRIVLKGIESEETSFSGLVTQFRKMKGVKGRIMRVKGYRRKKDLQVLSGLLLAGVFCISCTTTALAAGNGFAEVYDDLYYKTVVDVQETAEVFGGGLTEYTDVIDLSAENVVVMDGPMTRSAYIIEWDVPGTTTYRTTNYYVKKDGCISINLSVTPSDKKVKVGIIEPSGVRRYVESKGNVAHSFSISEAGNYSVFVENGNGTSVSVSGAFTY